MKKTLTALVVAAMSLLPSALSAKTVTFTIDDPEAAYMQNSYNGSYILFDGKTSVTAELDDEAGVSVNANSGYNLVSVTVGEENAPIYGESSYIYSLPDGSTVSITTEKKEPKTVYVIADPEQVSLLVDDVDRYNADNFEENSKQ